MTDSLQLALPALLYGGPLCALWLIWNLARRRRDRASLVRLAEIESAGLALPASIHPSINPNRCLGCGSCVPACPEGEVIGIVDGKARLIDPSVCVGHGACADACPMEAITLVLGTREQGVDVPRLTPEFETSVPGLYAVGEVGGIGLIRNAVTQGAEVIEAVQRSLGRHGLDLDVIIVGAGPAGLSASLEAKRRGLRALTLDQESLGGTVAHYPRRKLVMTAPFELPGYGRVKLRETTRESLLELWQEVAARVPFDARYGVRVDAIRRTQEGFEVQAGDGVHRARRVVLAIGRRGTPRKLDVPGEDLPKVVYRVTDPDQYRGQHVLVVGGGDSALEAAIAIAELAGDGRVTLAYRGDAFKRARPANRERAAAAQSAGRLELRLSTQVAEIRADAVRLQTGDTSQLVRNDAVIVCAGGVLPTAMLEAIGIETVTLRGEPAYAEARG